jgi:uridine kinase
MDVIYSNEKGRICSTHVFVGKSKRKRLLRRIKRKCEDNIKMYLKLVGRMWAVFIWLRIGTGGGLFTT